MKIEIPERMRHLKIDRRGYPVPHGVLIDDDGNPHFAINDHHVRQKTIANDLCGICGTKLFRGRWFVGGPLSAFHERGAFIDPPMHSECAHYAIKVCPYLAAPVYAREIGAAKAAKAKDALNKVVMFVDPTMIPGRPLGEVFVVLMTTGQTYDPKTDYLIPKRPYSRIEYWRHGKQISEAEASAFMVQQKETA